MRSTLTPPPPLFKVPIRVWYPWEKVGKNYTVISVQNDLYFWIQTKRSFLRSVVKGTVRKIRFKNEIKKENFPFPFDG